MANLDNTKIFGNLNVIQDTILNEKVTLNSVTEDTNIISSLMVKTDGEIVYRDLGTNAFSSDSLYTTTEINNIFSGVTPLTGYNKSDWDDAHGWGNHSGLYISSEVSDSASGKIEFGNTTTNRNAGIYGNYISTKIGHIWSMGTQYSIPADGSDFGNIYGAAYQYSSSLRALGHQFVWAQNGNPTVALGNDIWTSGSITASGGNSGNWNTAYTHSQSTHAPSDAEANVQSDWNATSGDAFILNKPTIPTDYGEHSGLYLPIGGGTLTGDLIVGATNRDSDTVIRALSNDTHKSGFEAYGNNQGNGYLYVGQDINHGGGISYNGDSSPPFITGETSDYITFFRRTSGVNHEVFSYAHSSDIVTFNGTIVASGSNSTDWNTAYAHITLNNNPHSVTASQVGAYSTTQSDAKYLLNTTDTFTGTLTITGGNPLAFDDDYVVNKNFSMIENASPQWILLCENGGNNDVNGNITIDRTSGNYQAVSLDVIVSSGSASMFGGALKTLQVLQSDEDYRLVSITYNSINYIAIKYVGNTYPMTHPARFTGRLLDSSGNALTVISSGVTNEVSFGGNSKAFYGVDDMEVSGIISASGSNSANWNTAYGWGDHSSENYLTSEANLFLAPSGGISTDPGTGKLIHTGQVSNGTTGLFSAVNNANSIITLNKHTGNYNSQLGFSSNGSIYYRNFNNETNYTTKAWEEIAFKSWVSDDYLLNTTDTLTGDLSVTGKLLATGNVSVGSTLWGTGTSLYIRVGSETSGSNLQFDAVASTATFNSLSVTANSFKTPSGTSSDFIKANGTFDSTDYQVTGEFSYATTTSTGYTLISLDKGKVKGFTSASAISVTINTGSLSAVGDITYVDQMGTGEITFVAGSGVSLLKNSFVQLKTDGQYSRVAIHKVGAADYRVFGELKPI